MYTLDVACLKAYVSNEDDYRGLLSSVGESVWGCLPGFKGPYFRPCVDVPQSILEARAMVGGTELVIRSLNNMSCSQAIVTSSDPSEVPRDFPMIAHKFKEVLYERVWTSSNTVQHRCTITCEYVIMDDMRELLAFWEPLASSLFASGKKYALRCYREANKDFFFHDNTRIINIRNTLQIVDTVNPIAEEEVAPQTAFEVTLELSAANEQNDEHLVLRLVNGIKRRGQLVADAVFTAPAAVLPPGLNDDSPIVIPPRPSHPHPHPHPHPHQHPHSHHHHPHQQPTPSTGVDIQSIISQLDQYMSGGCPVPVPAPHPINAPPAPAPAPAPGPTTTPHMTIMDALLEIQRIQEQLVTSTATGTGAGRSVAAASSEAAASTSTPAPVTAPRSFSIPPPAASKPMTRPKEQTAQPQQQAQASPGPVDSENLENLCKILEGFISTIGGEGSGGAAGAAGTSASRPSTSS